MLGDVVFIVSCPLGEELFENKCQPCLEEYYRSEINQPECVTCPYETSTFKTGSTTNKCYSKSPLFSNMQQISVRKCKFRSSRHLLVQIQSWKHQNNVRNLVKFNNNDTIIMSVIFFWWLSCKLWTDFTNCSGISNALEVANKNTTEAVVQCCSVKKVFFEISQNSQENTCATVSFLLKLQAWGLQLY